MKRLVALLDQASECKRWTRGYVPNHYKRLSVSREKARELAEYGFEELMAYYPPKKEGSEVVYEGIDPYFSQCLIAGAILCGEYDKITICTPSQYG